MDYVFFKGNNINEEIVVPLCKLTDSRTKNSKEHNNNSLYNNKSFESLISKLRGDFTGATQSLLYSIITNRNWGKRIMMKTFSKSNNRIIIRYSQFAFFQAHEQGLKLSVAETECE